jgi:hypothetical protein
MKDFRENLSLLESSISLELSKLRNDFPIIPISTSTQRENGEIDDYFERRNDTTGQVYDVFILAILPDGIKVVDVDDSTNINFIGIYDFGSVLDRISLYELIEVRAAMINKFIAQHGIRANNFAVRKDNDRHIKWGNTEFYIPEDGYDESDEFIYELLVEYNHV